MICVIRKLNLVPLLFGCFILPSVCALAQTPSPFSLLENVTANYENTVEATFVHQLTSDIWDEPQTTTGTVQLWGDQYRIETLHEIITGQGQEAWIYRPDENQVLLVTIDEEGLSYSPGTLLRSHENLYIPHDPAYEIWEGIPHFRLDLSPVQEDFAISSLRIWIRERDYMITRIAALDQNATRTELKLENIRVGMPISPETFEFTPPEGVEVIDLRS